MSILQESVFKNEEMPNIASVITDIDVSTLDEHIRLNMGPSNWRGVWFPLGHFNWVEH